MCGGSLEPKGHGSTLTTLDEIEAIEYRDAIVALQSVLLTNEGKLLFKYLFKYLEVGELPELGLEGSLLMDRLGSLRSGRSIFKLASEANPEIACQLLSKLERESYEQRDNNNDTGRGE